jgi:hypothetical protein
VENVDMSIRTVDRSTRQTVDMSRWLLVHPPLLGPAVLGPLADALVARGHDVAVPDLRGAVHTAAGWYDRFTALAATAGPAEALVGFSGAGVVLPAVAATAGARRVVWLDAVLPARSRATTTSPERLARLAGLVRSGRLAPWPTWWTPEELAAELPDEALRTAIAAEALELPGDFHDVPVPVPAAWPDGDVGYVQLSPAYAEDAAEARARGWRVAGDGTGRHLDVVTRPRRVLELVERAASG